MSTSLARALLLSVLCLPQAAMAGRLSDDLRLYSKALGYTLQYRVYSPDVAPGTRLPSLYVTDGDWYLRAGGMKDLLDSLIAAGRIQPLVAVFVDTRDPDNLRHDRRNEQLRCSADYARFFAGELVPRVDAAYPTRRSAESRVILGFSFGALNSACFGLMIPQVFGNIAMQSPGGSQHVRVVSNSYRQAGRLPLRFFLSVGTRNDNAAANRELRRVLEEKGYRVTYREVPYGHDWHNWRPLLPAVLETFFPPAPGAAGSGSSEPVDQPAGKDGEQDHRQQAAQAGGEGHGA